MHPNPSKFLTFLFSLLPGAGHMYFGLMKRGLSFMVLFAGTIALAFAAGMLSLTPILAVFGLAIPIVWFVAFFDFWRYPRMTAEEKTTQQDDFLFVQENSVPWRPIVRKLCVVGGIVLMLGGLQQLINQFVPWHVWRNLSPALGAGVLLALGLALVIIFARKPKQTPASVENEMVIESETEN